MGAGRGETYGMAQGLPSSQRKEVITSVFEVGTRTSEKKAGSVDEQN